MSERKSRVPASPKVRKFARELGLDINQIIGSKREGRVIESDVKNFVKEKTFQKSFSEKNLDEFSKNIISIISNKFGGYLRD